MGETPPHPDLAFVLVHYHTVDLLTESVRRIRQELDRHRLRGEVLVVDNGSDEADSNSLQGLAATVISPGCNLGYAGGINRGVSSTKAPVVVVMNPDVLLLEGCIASLLDELNRYDVVGPALFLDRRCTFRLPPTEQRGLKGLLIESLARRGGAWTRLARRAWRRHAWRYWDSTRPVRGFELSGAILAFRRYTWERVGPWDEGFKLYFEETDWLMRLKQRHLRAAYVPGARAVHLYAQSTRSNPEVAKWFAQSRLRFEQKHYRPWKLALSRWMRRAPTRGRPPEPVDGPHGIAAQPGWLEIASSPDGFPAARGRITGPDWDVGTSLSDVLAQLPAGPYYLRWLTVSGKERGVARVVVPQPGLGSPSASSGPVPVPARGTA